MYNCVDKNGNIQQYTVDLDSMSVTVDGVQYDLDSFLSQFIVPLTNHPAVPNAHGPAMSSAMASTRPSGFLVMSLEDGTLVYVPYWSKT